MDPIMVQHLARIRQQDYLETAARERSGTSYRELLWHAGSAMVTVGQRLMQATRPTFEAPRPAATPMTTENCL